MECPFGYSDKYFDMEYEYRYGIPSSHPSPRPHRSSPQTRHHPQGSRQTDPHGKNPHGTRVKKSWHSDEQRVDPLRVVPVWLATKTDGPLLGLSPTSSSSDDLSAPIPKRALWMKKRPRARRSCFCSRSEARRKRRRAIEGQILPLRFFSWTNVVYLVVTSSR